MGKVYEIRLTGNCTEINGTLIRIPSEITTPESANNGTSKDAYDHEGAMQFIIATILVYSICGVLCTLINSMKRLRGKSHQAYVQDENVQRYLKSEKYLKCDGRRTKMMYECEQVMDSVKDFEERQNLRDIEREIVSGEFAHAHGSEDTKKKKNRKKKQGKRGDLSGAVGHMGLSLFYMPRGQSNSKVDTGHVTSADEAGPMYNDSQDKTTGVRFSLDVVHEEELFSQSSLVTDLETRTDIEYVDE